MWKTNKTNKQPKKTLEFETLNQFFSPETWIYNTYIWTSLVVSKMTLQGEKEWCSVSRAICLCLSCILSMLFSLLVRGRGGYVGGGGYIGSCYFSRETLIRGGYSYITGCWLEPLSHLTFIAHRPSAQRTWEEAGTGWSHFFGWESGGWPP